ncbi:MAG: nucleotidyltransferase domain-containing protein [Bacteroidota bacterium]
MTEKIQQYLQQLEKEKNIKILLACETGSRAWGFPSPDSDFDVRMLYVHKSDWYLSVSERKDSIERMSENRELDIAGWELRKCLKLLRKSNAALLERIQSPILYQMDDSFLEDIQAVARQHYSRIGTMHHYWSMAKKILESIDADKPYKLKSFFYALRTACVCQWILEREEMPPIEFAKVYQQLDIDRSLVNRIEELIALKATKSESYLHTGEAELIALMHQFVNQAEAEKQTLPPGRGDAEKLDQLLQTYIRKYDH